MNENYTLAGKALKLLFIGAIVSLFAFLPVVGALLSLAGAVITLYALYTAMNAHVNYKNAMYMDLAAVVISLLGIFFSDGFFGGLLDILYSVVTFLVTYFVCTASAELLKQKGDQAQADRAGLIWKLYFVCAAVSVLCTLVSWIPLVNVLAAVCAVIMAIVQVVAYVLLIIFYYKASGSLTA